MGLELLISKEDIAKRVGEVAAQMRSDLKGANPLFLCVLKGAVVFASDLVRAYGEECELGFIRLSSRRGMASEGEVRERLALDEDVVGKTVVIVEDIVDTGLTVEYLMGRLVELGAREVLVATFCTKPSRLERPVKVDYSCFEVPDEFIVGYGLDLDERFRNLDAVYSLRE